MAEQPCWNQVSRLTDPIVRGFTYAANWQGLQVGHIRRCSHVVGVHPRMHDGDVRIRKKPLELLYGVALKYAGLAVGIVILPSGSGCAFPSPVLMNVASSGVGQWLMRVGIQHIPGGAFLCR